MRRPSALGVAAMLTLVVVLLAVLAWLAGWRREPAAMMLSRAVVVSEGDGAAALRFAGRGFSDQLRALLVPAAPLADADDRRLVPRLPLYRLQSNGTLAVASSRDRRLVTLDMRKGEPVRILASLKVREELDSTGVTISSLLLVGKHLLVGLSGNEGLLLVDLTNPAEPRKTAYRRMPGVVQDLVLADGRAYAAVTNGGLWQVDIENGRLALTEVPCPHKPYRLAAVDGRLAVATLNENLLLYELATGRPPQLVRQEKLPKAVRDLALGATALYLFLADGSLLEYDLGAWPRPLLRSRLYLPGRPMRVVRSDSPPRLYCSVFGIGVCAIDVSRPGAPSVAGWVQTALPVNDLAIAGDRLLTTDDDGVLISPFGELAENRLSLEFPLDSTREQMDLLNWGSGAVAVNYVEAARLDTPAPVFGTPAGVPGDQELLAVPGDNEVRFYRQPQGQGTRFVLQSTVPIKGRGVAVLRHGDRIYALSRTALQVFAISPAGGCTPLGRLDGFTDAKSLAWAGPDLLLVADRPRGIITVNVSDGDDPRAVAEQRLPSFIVRGSGGVHDLLVRGQRAYVSRGEFGVQVLDLATLPEPAVVEQIDTPGVARQLARSDDLLLIVDRGRGIQVVDLRDEPSGIVATIPYRGYVASFVATAEELLLGNSAAGLMRLPLPRRLEVDFDGGEGTAVLPRGLPAGRYRLVLYDGTRRADAEFTLN